MRIYSMSEYQSRVQVMHAKVSLIDFVMVREFIKFLRDI